MSAAWTYNDGGRKSAGYKGDAGDCVVRAISIALELPYQTVYDAMFQENQEYRSTRRGQVARALVKKGPSPQRWELQKSL